MVVKDTEVNASVSASSPMRLVFDQRYVYPWTDGRLAQCWLRVYKAPGRAMVLASEVDSYPRPANNTRMGVMAQGVSHRFGLPLDDTRWVAHRPGRGPHIRPYPNVSEQFEEACFEWTPEGLGEPEWRQCKRSEVEDLIGQPL